MYIWDSEIWENVHKCLGTEEMGSNIGMYPDMDNPTEYFGINHVFVNVQTRLIITRPFGKFTQLPKSEFLIKELYTSFLKKNIL